MRESEEEPFLVGDFNYVLKKEDTQRWDAHNFSKILKSLVESNGFTDAYRNLRPLEERYSWYCKGFAASRL